MTDFALIVGSGFERLGLEVLTRSVRTCIGLNTVGAIAPGFLPGELAVPDQLIDYTYGRASTYSGAGTAVRHIDFTEPFAPLLRGRIAAAIADCGFGVRAGTYAAGRAPDGALIDAQFERFMGVGLTKLKAVLARLAGR